MSQKVHWPFDEHMAEALRQAVSSTLMDVFQISIKPESWRVGKKMPLALDSLDACKIDVKQEDVLCGAFIAAFSRDIVLKVLRQCDPDATEDPKIIEDAVGEIANMIYGAFKTGMNKTGYRLSMNLPLSLSGEIEAITQYEGAEKMILPFRADGFSCRVIITQDHKDS
ncbi:MAG: chemotaxis protein CheX [Alphaproteobacteria bacterium]|nr:chemotaxis protein CheX [Alphaproteobacteria bacterium]